MISGRPWYGSNVVDILDGIRDDSRMERLDGANSIAGILIHMIAWTEEIAGRLRGITADNPARGDWPDPGTRTVAELELLFHEVNESLIRIIRSISEEDWDKLLPDDRTGAVQFTKRGYVTGLIQHHVYHSAQIALLNRQFSTRREKSDKGIRR